MSEEQLIQDIVGAFLRFQSDAMKRLTGAGIRVEDAVNILSRGIYECMFETVRLKQHVLSKINAPNYSIGHQRSIRDQAIHETVARGICETMLEELKKTNSKYVWTVWISKREKSLK